MENVELTAAELKGLTPEQYQEISDKIRWEGMTYQGKEFFDNIYMGEIYGAASDELELNRFDGQESYLGYLPNSNVFISGWDMFGEGDSWHEPINIAYFKIEVVGTNIVVNVVHPDNAVETEGCFYNGQYGGYQQVCKTHREEGIIHLRLD